MPDLLHAIWAALAAVWGGARDLVRVIIAPPALLAAVTVAMTFTACLAAWRLRRHPNPWRRYPAWGVAASLLAVLPGRTDDPSAAGRVLVALAFTLLLLGLARPPRRRDLPEVPEDD